MSGRMGAVVIPATTLLVESDLRDRIDRGKARHVVVRSVDAGKFDGVRGVVHADRGGWRRRGVARLRAGLCFDGPTRASDTLSVLIEHPAVAEAAVVPSPDPLRFAVPKAFVVLTAGHEPTRETALSILLHAREHLAPYKRIRRIEFYELPKTISGKIRRVELRAREEEDARAAAGRSPTSRSCALLDGFGGGEREITGVLARADAEGADAARVATAGVGVAGELDRAGVDHVADAALVAEEADERRFAGVAAGARFERPSTTGFVATVERVLPSAATATA